MRRCVGREGWTHQAHPHIHTTPLQIFPCLTKVNIWCRRRGSNLYHTGRAQIELYKKVWVLDKPRLLLTQVTQVLRVGYLNSNDLMINCIQLALEWRVPLMNLLSVNFFAPWLLFITSNIYNKILLVLFSLTAFNMLQLTAAFLLYRKTVHKLQGLSNHLTA